MLKPKVLILIDWFLPGYRAGGPTRSCANLIEHLKNDFDFSVITRDTDYMSSIPYNGIKSNEWHILPNGTRVYYFSHDRLSKGNVIDLVEKEKYDRLYLNGIFSEYFTIAPLRHLKGDQKRKVIVAVRGMLAPSALAIKKWKKMLFLSMAKMSGLFDNVLFHTTTEEERECVKAVFGNKVNVEVAPNLPEQMEAGEWKEKRMAPGLLKLVSVARIAPEKNIKYALEVLKEVKVKVQFDLYGPVYDQNYWNECKQVINSLPKNIEVNFRDSLDSKLVSEAMAQYDFLFLPTRGENFGHVILQSMGVGTPVIISDKTMWRHLESKQAGWDISLNNQSAFVSVIEKCSVMSQAEYNTLSKGAFDLAKAYMSNGQTTEQNRQLFLLKW